MKGAAALLSLSLSYLPPPANRIALRIYPAAPSYGIPCAGAERAPERPGSSG